MSTTITTTCNQCQGIIVTVTSSKDDTYNGERIHMEKLDILNKQEGFPIMEDVDFCSADCCAKYMFQKMDTGPVE